MDLKNELRLKDKIRDKIYVEKIKHDLITEEEGEKLYNIRKAKKKKS